VITTGRTQISVRSSTGWLLPGIAVGSGVLEGALQVLGVLAGVGAGLSEIARQAAGQVDYPCGRLPPSTLRPSHFRSLIEVVWTSEHFGAIADVEIGRAQPTDR
jgi:hypothetical protein